MAIEYPFSIKAGPVAVEREGDGWYSHPAFPWDALPEEADCTEHIKAWGYEGCWNFLSDDHNAPALYKRYVDSEEADCSYWDPTAPEGDGWFLAAIFDTESGPCALWFRPLT